MGVKHFNNGNEIVHDGHKGGTTSCGFDTSQKPSHWVNTRDEITCDKCKS